MNTVKLEREEFIKKHTGYLNEKQLQAVETIEGPVLLLAVPGSGKTTVLVTRLCDTLQNHTFLRLGRMRSP